MDDIRQQLAPGWSIVNIVLAVVLFTIVWPLGLLMIAYIIWGGRVGLDLGQPETLSRFWHRIALSFKAGIDTFKRNNHS